MKRRPSSAWEEIGYTVPDAALVNAEGAAGRRKDYEEFRERREEAASVPVRRATAKELFARIHAVIEGGEA